MPDLAISKFPSAVPGQMHTEQSLDTNINSHATLLYSLYHTNNYIDKSKSTHWHINTTTFIQYNYKNTLHYKNS